MLGIFFVKYGFKILDPKSCPCKRNDKKSSLVDDDEDDNDDNENENEVNRQRIGVYTGCTTKIIMLKFKQLVWG